MSRVNELLLPLQEAGVSSTLTEYLLAQQETSLAEFEECVQRMLKTTNLLAASVLAPAKCTSCGLSGDHDPEVCAVELAMYQRGDA